MTSAERYAIRVLIDRAKRNKLIADGVRAGHGAIKPGPIPKFTPARMNRSSRPYIEDEELIEAQQIELGAATAGHMLPSERRTLGHRVAA